MPEEWCNFAWLQSTINVLSFQNGRPWLHWPLIAGSWHCQIMTGFISQIQRLAFEVFSFVQFNLLWDIDNIILFRPVLLKQHRLLCSIQWTDRNQFNRFSTRTSRTLIDIRVFKQIFLDWNLGSMFLWNDFSLICFSERLSMRHQRAYLASSPGFLMGYLHLFTGPRCLWGPVYGSRPLYIRELCETLLMWLWLMMIPTQY